MENIHVLIFASAIAFAIAGTYIIWGPLQRPKRKCKGGVPGLQNLGNSCFLNAVLQALAACPSFISWLSYIITKVGEDTKTSYNFSLALLSLLKDLNKNYSICSPNGIIEALRQRRWVISSEEQDAHELFHVLTTTLEEELMAHHPVLSLLEVSKLQEDPKNEMSANSKSKTFISSCSVQSTKHTLPTRGLLANQLICKHCGYRYPVKYDTFDSISLVIPSRPWGKLKLQDCLQKFISYEVVSGVTCEVCSKQEETDLQTVSPKYKTTFIKQQSFGKLPECLCFHIQRTVWLNNGMSTKCHDHVEFPEILVMDDYVYNAQKCKDDVSAVNCTRLTGGSSNKVDNFKFLRNNSIYTQASLFSSIQKPVIFDANYASNSRIKKNLQGSSHVYRLKAVIVHLGDLLSGHFVTYRRGPVNNLSEEKWFCASDTSVREVRFSDVLQASAYMTFYERML